MLWLYLYIASPRGVLEASHYIINRNIAKFAKKPQKQKFVNH